MKIKHSYTSAITGELHYLENGNLIVKNSTVNKEFSKTDLQELSDHYRGANRIHKPVALLFWQDCKNGQISNWK